MRISRVTRWSGLNPCRLLAGRARSHGVRHNRNARLIAFPTFSDSRSSRSSVERMLRVMSAAMLLGGAHIGLNAAEHALVLHTDFGLKDGAVGAMRGVAATVSLRIPIHDLSHENTPFDIWEAAYRLKQAAPYWPAGTAFVSVVDPGVGTDRKAVVLKPKSGHYFVGPDNGAFTLIAEDLGIEAVRVIDESKHRRRGSERSYTFHGRE